MTWVGFLVVGLLIYSVGYNAYRSDIPAETRMIAVILGALLTLLTLIIGTGHI